MSVEAEEPTSTDEHVEVVDPDDMEAQIEAALRASMQDETDQVEITDDQDSQGEQAAAPLELNEETEQEVAPEPVAEISETEKADLSAYLRQAGIEEVGNAQELVQMRDWYQSLSQDELRAIDSTLNDLRDGTPVAEVAPTPEPVATAPTLNIPGMEMFDDDERAAFGSAIADYVQSSVSPLREELDGYQAQQRSAEQAAQEADNARISNGVEIGYNAFVEAHPELSDIEVAHIQDVVVKQGIWQTHFVAANNDAEAATTNAYEQVLLSDTDLREKFISAQVAAERELTVADDERKQNLASISGGGSPAAADTVSSQASQFDDPLAEAIAEYQRNST